MNATRTLPGRRVVLPLALVAACGFVGVFSGLLADGLAGTILPDRRSALFPYPWTIQNLMHLFFFAGLGEARLHWRTASRELAFIGQGLLPEDESTVLQARDLPPIRRRVASGFDEEHGFLPSLIDLCILQFQASRSVDQTASVLDSSLELISHRVDLRYTLLRYLVWLIPTIGFIGTVIGIAMALQGVDPANPDLRQLTGALGVSFYTTLVALVQSAILVLLMNWTQALEERSVNAAGHYTLRNLINRLYTGTV